MSKIGVLFKGRLKKAWVKTSLQIREHSPTSQAVESQRAPKLGCPVLLGRQKRKVLGYREKGEKMEKWSHFDFG